MHQTNNLIPFFNAFQFTIKTPMFRSNASPLSGLAIIAENFAFMQR